MTAASDYFSEFGGDGVLDVDGDEVSWRPPADGGTLRWRVDPNRKRSDTAYDAYLGADWALFRASDIFPPAATRTLKGAVGITTLQFDLPRGWSSVTQYKEADGRYPVDNPQRRFDRPTGWILLGNVGTRTDDISGTRVTVAAPANHGIRRMDMLAMLRWTLPEIRRLFDDYPNRITVFSAGEPMWRGGLSAPSSVYVHSGRPLISENGTSTLLHELVHVGMGMSAHPDADWIIEGFAEYYSLQLLLRSGSISKRRYDKSIAALAEWGQDARGLCSGTSGGAVTAKATAIMHDLNIALKSKSEGASSLDDVMRVLVEQHQKLKTSGFVNAVNRLAGQELQFLQHAEIANCTDLQT